jgi:DNA-binding winged helix-turn-helix (wHTH) protein
MPSEVMSMQEPDNPVIPGPGLLSSGRYIHFGPFRIDQQRQEVTRNGARLKLQGKVYQTLLTLLEKPGEVVTREELRARLWPADTHVNYDANVNTTVNKLRMALGDSSDKPLYVETIPRKGYSLLVQPEISNRVGNTYAAPNVSSGEGAEKPAAGTGIFRVSKSDLWVVLSAIALILAGMLLGAGIMRLWMNHAPSVSTPSLEFLLSRVLEKVFL